MLGTMDFLDYVNAVRTRWVAVVVLLVIGALAGFGIAYRQPSVYQASASLFVSADGGASTSDLLQGSTFTQSIVSSYASLASMPVVLQPVVTKLHLPETAAQL